MPMSLTAVNITPDGRLSRASTAAYLGVASKTLANWALKGFGPPSLKIGGRRFYRLADLQGFIARAEGV